MPSWDSFPVPTLLFTARQDVFLVCFSFRGKSHLSLYSLKVHNCVCVKRAVTIDNRLLPCYKELCSSKPEMYEEFSHYLPVIRLKTSSNHKARLSQQPLNWKSVARYLTTSQLSANALILELGLRTVSFLWFNHQRLLTYPHAWAAIRLWSTFWRLFQIGCRDKIICRGKMVFEKKIQGICPAVNLLRHNKIIVLDGSDSDSALLTWNKSELHLT